jgi:hypothetical protein
VLRTNRIDVETTIREAPISAHDGPRCPRPASRRYDRHPRQDHEWCSAPRSRREGKRNRERCSGGNSSLIVRRLRSADPSSHEYACLDPKTVLRLLLSECPHARHPLRRLQIHESALSVERPVPRHVAEGQKGDRRVPLRLGPGEDPSPSRTEAITIPTGRSFSRPSSVQPTHTCPIPTSRTRLSIGYDRRARLRSAPGLRTSFPPRPRSPAGA